MSSIKQEKRNKIMKTKNLLLATIALLTSLSACKKEVASVDVSATPWHCTTPVYLRTEPSWDNGQGNNYNYGDASAYASTAKSGALKAVNSCIYSLQRLVADINCNDPYTATGICPVTVDSSWCTTNLTCTNQLTNSTCKGATCLN